jgi:hypothetical protein
MLAHADDAANRDAMKACHVAPPGKRGDAGPCGVERHAVEIAPGAGAPKPVPPELGRAAEPETSGAN